MKLKLCPLNLSQNILLNQFTYVNRIDDIYFDLEHDSNHEINRWFDFMLNMVDEQIYYNNNKLVGLKKKGGEVKKNEITLYHIFLEIVINHLN